MKTFKIFLVIFYLFGFLSCNTNESNIQLDDKEIILINSDYNQWLKTEYGYKTWKPEQDDFRVLDVVINEAIINDKFDFIKQPIKDNIEAYYRQYIPYVNEHNERIIKINAFCELIKIPPTQSQKNTGFSDIDWKNEYVAVDDGGSCYWEITINIDTKKYN